MDIRAGRDVNMAAESTGAGDHDSTFSMKTVHDSVRQQGTDMTSGGDITVTAGRDITSVATAVTAKGDIRVNAVMTSYWVLPRKVIITTVNQGKPATVSSAIRPPGPSRKTASPVRRALCCRGIA